MDIVAKEVDVMNDDGWATLLQFLPSGWQDKMRETGAFTRARQIKTPGDLLRIIFAVPVLRMSLPELSRWALERDLADLAFPSLWERLQKSLPFLRWLIGALLGTHFPFPGSGLLLAPIDATSFTLPASYKRDWLLHLVWADGSPVQAAFRKLSGKGTGESLKNLAHLPACAVRIGDRAYGTPPQVAHAYRSGQKALVRFSWNHLPLYADPWRKQALDPRTLLADMLPGEVHEWPAWVRAAGEDPTPVRIVVIRKTPETAERAIKTARRESIRKGHTPKEITLFLAHFVTLVTVNLSPEEVDTQTIAETYRWRWQIEREFRRLKGSTQVRHLANQKDSSVEVYLLALLAVWLLAHHIAKSRSFFPWGVPLRATRQGRENQS